MIGFILEYHYLVSSKIVAQCLIEMKKQFKDRGLYVKLQTHTQTDF